MNHLNTYLAHHEIDRRLRAVDHQLRIRRGRHVRKSAEHTLMAACVDR